jgi:tRNA/rRNA methyltransferase
MCARAMGNLGASRLIVVDSRCDLSSEEAKQGAAHAQTILRNAVTYGDLNKFILSEGEGIRLALSGRDGRLKRPDGLEATLTRFASDPEHRFLASNVPIYLIFGPEDDGLSNEEMELCHQVCRLPSTEEIPSLNLSHAVILTLFIVRSALAKTKDTSTAAELLSSTQETLKGESIYFPQDSIQRWLEALGFDLSARRVNIEKTLNRILLSRCPSPEELRILNTIVQQTIRKLTDRF